MVKLVKREKDGCITIDTFSDGSVVMYPQNPLYIEQKPVDWSKCRWRIIDMSNEKTH